MEMFNVYSNIVQCGSQIKNTINFQMNIIQKKPNNSTKEPKWISHLFPIPTYATGGLDRWMDPLVLHTTIAIITIVCCGIGIILIYPKSKRFSCHSATTGFFEDWKDTWSLDFGSSSVCSVHTTDINPTNSRGKLVRMMTRRKITQIKPENLYALLCWKCSSVLTLTWLSCL